MKKFAQEEQIIAGAMLILAVLLTPVAGVWIWLALGLGLWVAASGTSPATHLHEVLLPTPSRSLQAMSAN